MTDPLQRLTVSGYDSLSRLYTVSNPAIQMNPLVTRTYSPNGHLASLSIARSNSVADTTSFAYDGLDRLATTTYPLGSTETLAYDADSNVLTRKTRATQTIVFAYDTLNRLTSKTTPTAVASFTYDLNNRLLAASDNGAALVSATSPPNLPFATTATYDQLNRPTNIAWTPAAAAAAAPAASSVTFGHTYNKVNQRIGQTASDNTWLNYPAPTPSVTSYSANQLNQYTAVGAVTPTYDNNGNLTFDGTFTYGYDAENRLVSASGPGITATYAYDAQGRRKSKTVNGTTTIFVTDAGNREILEYDGTSGAIQNWYAYGSGANDVLNQMNVVAAARATLVPDIQGSVIASLDSSSGALTKRGYLPYGASASVTGTFAYTGQRIDPETNGLYYYRARHYMPSWGRFVQVDPSGYQGGNNLYAYVGNDPLNSTDLFGLDTQYSLGMGGTLAFYVLGAGASASVGVNVPDVLSNIGGYQIFFTSQVNGMGGGGAFAGYGVVATKSTSAGPLPLASANTGWYGEFDVGAGPSVGVSIQGTRSGVAGASISPPITVGSGYGIWVGGGVTAGFTAATPTLGDIYNSVTSVFAGSSTSNQGSGILANSPGSTSSEIPEMPTLAGNLGGSELPSTAVQTSK